MTMASSRQLETFAAVAKHLNVSRAARELHVTPSAISHNLDQLRKTIGVPLTRRTGSGVELTKAGEAVRIKAESILLQLDSLSTMFRTVSADRLEENLAIGASHGPSIRLVPELLARFQSQFPRLRVTVRTGTSKEIELLLRQQTVEVAFLSNPSNASALTIEPIASERLLFVVAKKHPLAKKPMFNTAEVADLPLLVGEGQDGKTSAVDVIKRSLPETIKLSVKAKFDSPGALRAAVMNGMGVGVLYEDMVVDEIRDGSLKELTVAGINLAGHSYLAYLKNKALFPAAVKFVEAARLQRAENLRFENPLKSGGKRDASLGLIGKKQYSKRDAAGVLIER
jgi:DNA-binding transcriptional LysR family regulator